LEDYYAILGVDPGASPESIKLAYRRLARECHPDRNPNSTEAERLALSARMVQLNGAYAVLSNETRRREYDNQARILTTLNAHTVSNLAKTVGLATTVAKTSSGQRSQSARDAELTLVREFLEQLRLFLLGSQNAWEERALEGFDWGLDCVSWSSHYCVGGRGFATLDPSAARKFANYCEIAVARFNRSIRQSHFLFLLPFHRLSNGESVSAEFNRLLAALDGETKLNAPVRIMLFDLQKGRTVRIGPHVGDKRFEELLELVGNGLLTRR
jgi:curved DNA-binding protein CbpA